MSSRFTVSEITNQLNLPSSKSLWFYTDSLELVQLYSNDRQLTIMIQQDNEYTVQLGQPIQLMYLGGWWESKIHSLNNLPTIGASNRFDDVIYDTRAVLFLVRVSMIDQAEYLVFLWMNGELTLVHRQPAGNGTHHYLTRDGYVHVICRQTTFEVISRSGDVYRVPRMHRLNYSDFTVNEYGLLYSANRQVLYISWNYPTRQAALLDVRNRYVLNGKYLLETVPTTGTMTAINLITGESIRSHLLSHLTGTAVAYDQPHRALISLFNSGIIIKSVYSTEHPIVISDSGNVSSYQWIPESSILVVQYTSVEHTKTLAFQLLGY